MARLFLGVDHENFQRFLNGLGLSCTADNEWANGKIFRQTGRYDEKEPIIATGRTSHIGMRR